MRKKHRIPKEIYQKAKVEDIPKYEQELKMLNEKYNSFITDRITEVESAITEGIKFFYDSRITSLSYRITMFTGKQPSHCTPSRIARDHTLLRNFITLYYDISPNSIMDHYWIDNSYRIEVENIRKKNYFWRGEQERQRQLDLAYNKYLKSKMDHNKWCQKYKIVGKYFDLLSEYNEIPNRIVDLKKTLDAAYEKQQIIEIQRKKRDEDYLKHENAYAKAASLDRQTRTRAPQVIDRLYVTERCPYCGRDIGEEPHADHIYPVSVGGLSSLSNMVYCCKRCNLIKRDRGLVEFLISEGFSVEEVTTRLIKMGKKV